MGNLFILALSPILICLFYIYIRDKYEKEPYNLLIVGVIFGVVMTIPIIFTGKIIVSLMPDIDSQIFESFYKAFFVASFVEEGYKFVILFFLIWRNQNFNEPLDGIVYAVFISLGFAGIENVLYVFHPTLGGVGTAIGRAFISVPLHALFGVFMGYYFSLSKFEKEKKVLTFLYAFIVPWFLHGLYNFILTSGFYYLWIPLIVVIAYMFISGLKKIKIHLEKSPFKKFNL